MNVVILVNIAAGVNIALVADTFFGIAIVAVVELAVFTPERPPHEPRIAPSKPGIANYSQDEAVQIIAEGFFK